MNPKIEGIDNVDQKPIPGTRRISAKLGEQQKQKVQDHRLKNRRGGFHAAPTGSPARTAASPQLEAAAHIRILVPKSFGFWNWNHSDFGTPNIRILECGYIYLV